MTVREIYFILSAFGTSTFLMLAFTTQLRHSWRFPFNWYTFIMLYLGVVCITFLPMFDSWRDYSKHPTVFLIHDCFVNMLAPLLMTAFLRISLLLKRLSLKSFAFIWLPFIIYQFCFHYISDTAMLLYISYGYIAFSCLWWSAAISRQINVVHLRPQTDYRYEDEDEEETLANIAGIKWMRFYAYAIAIVTILYWGVRTFFHVKETDTIRPELLFILVIVLPFYINYEWRYSRHRYFDKFILLGKTEQGRGLKKSKKQNANAKGVDEVTSLAAKVMAKNRGKLPANALLPELTAASTRTHGVSSKVDSAVNDTSYNQIEEGLRKLEMEADFFLDKELTTGILANRLKVSRSLLNSYFHDQGTTFYNYVERQRVIYAGKMILQQPSATLESISFASGFSSLSNFNMAFSDYYHVSPKDYRRMNK